MDLFPLARPALRALDPERAHKATLWALRHGLAPVQRTPDDPRLGQTLWGRRFPNPLGLAAGFDKDAEAIAPLLDLGFGFVEVGTVTPRPQPGNPKPRLFRLPADGAVINRFGFNSQGQEVVAAHLRAFREGRRDRESGAGGLVGVNLGKNKTSEDATADYIAGIAALGPLADYIAINVSSPNTPGLRALQSRGALAGLLAAACSARDALPESARPPLLLKIAPDLTPADREDIAAVALDTPVDGLIVSNTTLARPEHLTGRHRRESGGLSGRPLLTASTALLADMYRLTRGELILIGVGGVASAEDALAKIGAGASLVQLYSSLAYQGPSLIKAIKNGLIAALTRRELKSVREIVGRETNIYL